MYCQLSVTAYGLLNIGAAPAARHTGFHWKWSLTITRPLGLHSLYLCTEFRADIWICGRDMPRKRNFIMADCRLLVAHFYFHSGFDRDDVSADPAVVHQPTKIQRNRALRDWVTAIRQNLNMAAVHHIGLLFLHAGPLTTVLQWSEDALKI